MNEQEAEDRRVRGERAERLLNDPLFVEAWEDLERYIVESWKETHGSDREQRENAYLMHRLMRKFRDNFESAIRTGNQAKRDLLEIRDPGKLRKMIHGR